jgi:hypothetical protein
MRDDVEPESPAAQDRALLFFVSWWVFDVFADARQAAIRFLDEHATEFDGAARRGIAGAADLYRQEREIIARAFSEKNAFLGPWSGKTITDWTSDVRQREAQMLGQCRTIEERAISWPRPGRANERGLLTATWMRCRLGRGFFGPPS